MELTSTSSRSLGITVFSTKRFPRSFNNHYSGANHEYNFPLEELRTMKRLVSCTIILALFTVLLLPGFSRSAAAADLSPVFAKYRAQVERSVDKGLAWLAKQQISSEKAKQLNQPFLAGSMAQRKLGNTGIHSLAVMAFLAKGHTPGLGPYGTVINKGIDYLLTQQHANGLLVSKASLGQTHGQMYSHCISTLMLCEVSGMVDPARQKGIDEVLPKAIGLILKAQQVPKVPRNAGGWRYTPTSRDSDLSLTGWAVLSLRAARMNGAAVPDENINNAIQYIVKCRHAPTGGFGYQPNGNGRLRSQPKLGLTGAAVLCLTLLGQHDHPSIEPAGKFLISRKPTRFSSGMTGYYDIYYASQATFQFGGEVWAEFAPWMYENLLSVQQPGGEWPPCDSTCGSSYSTALAILAMTPPYRQLPIYQRDDLIPDDLPPKK